MKYALRSVKKIFERFHLQFIFPVIFFLSAPLLALGDTAPDAPIKDYTQFVKVAEKIRDWLATIFWIAAIIAIFYAAFLFLTGSGDEEKLKKAKKQLLYALIAIAVALMATGFKPLINSILKTGSS